MVIHTIVGDFIMLFTPGTIGLLELPNRLVRSATAERMADDDGNPLPRLSDLYRDLVQGGIGLIITGHMYVCPEGKCHPEMVAVDSDSRLPGLKELVRSIHEKGGKAVVQINHGGGKCALETQITAYSPSPADQDSLFGREVQELTEENIQGIIKDFALAARRVQRAGFDGVQIHAAHGYLAGQFLSPLTNFRNDQWGGSLSNRQRFLREVSLAVRDVVGDEYPVLIKFGIADGVPGGLSLEDGLETASQFESWGLDGIEISSGFGGELFSSIKTGVKSPQDEGYFLPFVKEVQEVTELPILAVGGFRSRMVMEKTLLSGGADFISICRPLIRDPQLPNRLQSGDIEVSDCISANLCWAEGPGEGISCKCTISNS
jgi:2,4-dienoyl-CoA reductase-like NADH-dependent reductase (Old Yellow Enzyme family)